MAKYPHDAPHSDGRFPNATIDHDEIEGLHGNETIHGWARVGGSEVIFKNKRKEEKLVFMEYK